MDINKVRFALARTDSEFKAGKILFKEYSDSLKFSLDFQDFEKEMQSVPEKYGAPAGALLLCYYEDLAVGCVGVRSLEEGIAEIKRLYVKPEYRSLKLGKQLMVLAVDAAKDLGYAFIRLDSVREMKAAVSLYEKMGFYEIEAYCYNPLENPVYMEKAL
nr:GNAT family N-acetyltransferase [uncultured Flavobacterium sp.]